MEQKKSKRLTFTILSISFLTVMAGAAMAPALGVISAHFSDCSNMLVQLIVSLPALFIILTNFFFPAICKVLRTRTIALVGLVMYCVLGAGAFFVDNIWLLLAMRALLGVSVGLIMPLSTGLLAFYFLPQEQASLMGLSAFMNQMGGVVATLLSGLLCGLGWNFSFLVYLMGVLALVLVLLYLPNEKLVTGEATMQHAPDYYETETGITKARKKPGRPVASMLRFAPSVVGMFLQMLIFFIVPTNFAIISLQNPALNVTLITIIMVGLDLVAAPTGIAFGWMMKKMGRQVKYMAPVGFMIGFGLFAMGTDLWLLICGSVVVGFANGVGVPYINTIASIKGGKDAATTVMPLLSAALFLGQFVSPLIVSPLAALLGGSLAPYWVGVAFSLLYLVQAFCSRRYQALAPAEM